MPNDNIFILVTNLFTFVHIKNIKNILKNRMGKYFRMGKVFLFKIKFIFPFKFSHFSTFKTLLCYAISLWLIVVTFSLTFYYLFSKFIKIETNFRNKLFLLIWKLDSDHRVHERPHKSDR